MWPLKVILTRRTYISKDVYMYFLSLSNAIKYIMSLRSKVADAESALRRHIIDYKRTCSHAWSEPYSLSICLFIHSHVHKWRSSLRSLSLNSKVSNVCLRKTIYFYSFPAVSYKWFNLLLPEERIQKADRWRFPLDIDTLESEATQAFYIALYVGSSRYLRPLCLRTDHQNRSVRLDRKTTLRCHH